MREIVVRICGWHLDSLLEDVEDDIIFGFESNNKLLNTIIL